MIREKTVIAVIHLAPKLTFTNLDETVVMKNFSRLLRDEQVEARYHNLLSGAEREACAERE